MAPIRDGDGIYLGESTVSTSNDEARSATSDERSDSVEEEEIPSSDAESDEDDFTKANNASFFAALNIEDK
jgi:hypothetical protein